MIDAKIVVDSSANLACTASAVSTVPLKIITQDHEYLDDATLDATAMVEALSSYSGKSSTACPSPNDWLATFDDKPYIFCISISSGLSGCCNAANIAKADYEQAYPGRQVCVIDSLSTGGEMELIAEKIQELIEHNLSFEQIVRRIHEYQKSTSLFFMLESMQNLVNNGRVSRIAAKAAGFLGIRIVGKPSETGTLRLLEKCRGERKAIAFMVEDMLRAGYRGGKVRISHCLNLGAARRLKEQILALHPMADIRIRPSGGLCSFYAEKGGLIIGYEK